jgi:hypothetical protein
MRGSLAVADVMANGDTADFVISYADTFEEVSCTYNSAGNYLVRGTTSRSRHVGGTVDQSHVSFASGQKTVILTFSSARARSTLRFDAPQTLTAGQKRQAYDNLGSFPSGTKMIFRQSTPPIGWTKDTSKNDCGLRITSGALADGGSVDFSTCFARTATDAFTLDQSNLPSVNFALNLSDLGHEHIVDHASVGVTQILESNLLLGTIGPPQGRFLNYAGGSVAAFRANNATTGITGTAASGGSSAPKTAGMDMRLKFADVIVAIKD